MSLKSNIIKYRLIEEHIKTVKSGELVLARELLFLLQKHQIKVGPNDIGCKLELIAEKCGCRISYSRNYDIATIKF